MVIPSPKMVLQPFSVLVAIWGPALIEWSEAIEWAESLEWPLMIPGFLAFIVGTGLAYRLYVVDKGAQEATLQDRLKRIVPAVPGVLVVIVGAVLVRAFGIWGSGFAVLGDLCVVSGGALAWFYRDIGFDKLYDKTIIDGLIAKVTAFVVAALGTVLRAFQTGVVHVYALAMVVGVVVMGWFFVAPHADTTVAKGGDDYTITAGSGAGYLDYTYEWSQCEPVKKQWSDEYAKANTSALKAAELEFLNAKHASCDAPGDKWTAVGKEGFTDQAEVKLHIDADGDEIPEAARPVRLRAKNTFSASLRDWTSTSVTQVPRQVKPKMLEVGQN